jgi:hypothetical protein
MMQGSTVDYTAGKISGGAVATRHLWYEARSNRVKTSIGDANCPSTGGSCGFTRHVRINTDISFTGGDISNVSNMSGMMSDASDSTGSSGQTDRISVVTATGNLSTGLTGKVYSATSAPSALTTEALSNLTIGTTTCIPSAGAAITTGGACTVAPLQPTGAIKTFLLPANSTTWLSHASQHGGVGFSTAVTSADEQFPL